MTNGSGSTPRPRSPGDIANLKPSYRMFVGRRVRRGRRRAAQDDQPGHRARCWPRSAPPARRDVDRAVQAAARRALREGLVRGCPAPSGPSTCSGSPGSSPERARELAVLESLDNGKPIRESRDVDVPTASAHFFYHAGWADKLRLRGLRARPEAAGRRRAGDPVELPAADGGVEDRAGAGRGNTVVLKPAETTPLTALVLAEICQQAELPPGVVNILPGAGDIGAHAGGSPGHRQGGVHRLDRGGQADPVVAGRHRSQADPGAGRQGGEHRVRRRPAGPGRRGHRQRHLLQPGPRLLRRLAAAGAGVDRRGGAGEAAGPRSPRCASATRWTRTPTSARSTRPSSWPRSRELVEAGDAEGAERWTSPCPLPDEGFFFAPTVFTNVTPVDADRPRGDLRPGAVGADVPHPGRGGRQGEQHAVRPVGGHLDREGLADPGDGQPAAGRRGLGQHVQPVRPDRAVRRLPGVRLRSRGRPRRAGGVPRVSDRRELDRREDVQALHRRRVPALRVRPDPTR